MRLGIYTACVCRDLCFQNSLGSIYLLTYNDVLTFNGNASSHIN